MAQQPTYNDVYIKNRAAASAQPVSHELQLVEALYHKTLHQQVDYPLRQLEQSMARQKRLFAALGIASLNIRDLMEMRIACQFFADFFPNSGAAKLGIMELCMNAIEHGNLGITGEEKQQLIAEDRWLDEINHRLSQPQYMSKRVHIHCYQSKAWTKISIRDEGQGFVPEQYLDQSKEQASHAVNGRGLALAKHLAFEEIGYQHKANTMWGLQYHAAPNPIASVEEMM